MATIADGAPHIAKPLRVDTLLLFPLKNMKEIKTSQSPLIAYGKVSSADLNLETNPTSVHRPQLTLTSSLASLPTQPSALCKQAKALNGIDLVWASLPQRLWSQA